jgi:hypothetical protein
MCGNVQHTYIQKTAFGFRIRGKCRTRQRNPEDAHKPSRVR